MSTDNQQPVRPGRYKVHETDIEPSWVPVVSALLQDSMMLGLLCILALVGLVVMKSLKSKKH